MAPALPLILLCCAYLVGVRRAGRPAPVRESGLPARAGARRARRWPRGHENGLPARTGARRSRGWPRSRTVSFLAGLGVLGLALGSGLAAGAEERLSLHMIQHVLITLVAPPLLLAGRPVSLLTRSLPAAAGRRVAAALRARAFRVLTRPLVAWSLFSLVLVATHLPAFYEATMRSELLHAGEHAAYFWSALLLWAAALGAEPLPGAASPLMRILTLLLAMPPMALVGVALIGWDGVAYPHYGLAAARLGISAAADQQLAGWVMWVGGGAVVAVVTMAAGWRALSREEARQAARDARLDAGAKGIV